MLARLVVFFSKKVFREYQRQLWDPRWGAHFLVSVRTDKTLLMRPFGLLVFTMRGNLGRFCASSSVRRPSPPRPKQAFVDTARTVEPSSRHRRAIATRDTLSDLPFSSGEMPVEFRAPFEPNRPLFTRNRSRGVAGSER